LSPDTRRLREFACRNWLPHRVVDLEEDESAEALLRRLGISPDETPVVIWREEQVLRNPERVAAAVGEGSTAVRFVHQYLTESGAPDH